jgi:hypothetical protein
VGRQPRWPVDRSVAGAPSERDRRVRVRAEGLVPTFASAAKEDHIPCVPGVDCARLTVPVCVRPVMPRFTFRPIAVTDRLGW